MKFDTTKTQKTCIDFYAEYNFILSNIDLILKIGNLSFAYLTDEAK